MHLAPIYHLFAGVDIAATTFTAVWGMPQRPPAPPRTFPQDADGFAAFQPQLAATTVAPEATLIVLEATGSYWVALAVALHAAGYHISVINPAQSLTTPRRCHGARKRMRWTRRWCGSLPMRGTPRAGHRPLPSIMTCDSAWSPAMP